MKHKIGDYFTERYTDGTKEIFLEFHGNREIIIKDANHTEVGNIQFRKKRDSIYVFEIKDKSVKEGEKKNTGLFKYAPTLALERLEKLAKKTGFKRIDVDYGGPYWEKQGYLNIHTDKRNEGIQKFIMFSKKPNRLETALNKTRRTHCKPLLTKTNIERMKNLDAINERELARLLSENTKAFTLEQANALAKNKLIEEIQKVQSMKKAHRAQLKAKFPRTRQNVWRRVR